MAEDPLAVEANRGVKRRRLFSRYEEAVGVDAPDANDKFLHPFNKASSPWLWQPVNPVFGPDRITAVTYEPTLDGGAFSTGVFFGRANNTSQRVYGLVGGPGILRGDEEDTVEYVEIQRFPLDLIVAGGSDKHAEIIDPAGNVIHSFWQMYPPNTAGNATDVYRAFLYCQAPLDGTGFGDPARYNQGARASECPPTGGLIRLHEQSSSDGDFGHALAASMPQEMLSSVLPYVWPATNKDSGFETNSGAFPYGTLFMLDTAFATDRADLMADPFMAKLYRTIQKYGIYIVDRNTGTPFGIYMELGSEMHVGTPSNSLVGLMPYMQPVIGVDSWIDGNGDARAEFPGNLNLISMRGSWTGGAYFSSALQAVVLPAGSGGTFTCDAVSAIRHVDWAGPDYDNPHLLTAICDPGCTLRAQIIDGGENIVQDTGVLADGDSASITFPQFTRVHWIATHPGGVSTLTVSARLDDTGPAPAYVSAEIPNEARNTVLITLDKAHWGLVSPLPAAYALTGKTITDASVRGFVVTLTVSVAFAYGDTSNVSYVKPASRKLHDQAGHETESFGPHAVTNNIDPPDTTHIKVRMGALLGLTETGNGTIGWIYTGSGGSYSTARGNTADQSIPDGADGEFIVKVGSVDSFDSPLIQLSSSNGSASFAGEYAMDAPGTFRAFTTGAVQVAGAGVSAPSDLIKLKRADSVTVTNATLTYEYSHDNGGSWTILHTLTGQPTPELFPSVAVVGSSKAINLRITDQSAAGPLILGAEVFPSDPRKVYVRMSKDLSGTLCASSAFAIAGKTISSITSVNARRYYLTLTADAAGGDAVSYTKPGSNPLQDSLGNETASTSSPIAITIMANVKVRFGNLAAQALHPVETGSGGAGWIYTGDPSGNYGICQASSPSVQLAAGDDGEILAVLGGTVDAFNSVWLNMGDGVDSFGLDWPASFRALVNGSGAATGPGAAAGYSIRVRRLYKSILLDYSTDSEVSWTNLYTATASNTNALVPLLLFLASGQIENIRAAGFT